MVTRRLLPHWVVANDISCTVNLLCSTCKLSRGGLYPPLHFAPHSLFTLSPSSSLSNSALPSLSSSFSLSSSSLSSPLSSFLTPSHSFTPLHHASYPSVNQPPIARAFGQNHALLSCQPVAYRTLYEPPVSVGSFCLLASADWIS